MTQIVRCVFGAMAERSHFGSVGLPGRIWLRCRNRSARRWWHQSFACLTGSLRRDEAVRAILIEREYRMSSEHLCVRHQSEIPVVQNQPLSIHTRRQHRMVLVSNEISQDDDFHIVARQSCLQQCGIFHDSVILAVAPVGLQRLERRAPAIVNAPLRLIARRRDREIDSPVDQANASQTRATGALRDNSQQLSRGRGTGFSGTAVRQDGLFLFDFGLDKVSSVP
jgi:hypothetical protein